LRVLELDGLLGDREAGLGGARLSLGGDGLAGLVGLCFFGVVGLDPGDEGGPALRGAQVLDAHVDALGDDAVPDQLVHDDADGSRVHVEDLPGPAVVELVRHALR